VIYDPFAGSGTSGVVAFKLNRKWIGSDISPDACKLAFKRLQSLGCNASLCLNAE
jgi:site-specific DNA-methyltransferase (adenine-specific)